MPIDLLGHLRVCDVPSHRLASLPDTIEYRADSSICCENRGTWRVETEEVRDLGGAAAQPSPKI